MTIPFPNNLSAFCRIMLFQVYLPLTYWIYSPYVIPTKVKTYLILLVKKRLLCCQVASVVSDPVRPHRRQPTGLPRPWDSPGKNTGVGCHFLLQCMTVKSEREVAQSCPTLSDPMDCSPPGFSVHGIFQQEYWGGVPLPSPRDSYTSF